jgi:hypothetical protein
MVTKVAPGNGDMVTQRNGDKGCSRVAPGNGDMVTQRNGGYSKNWVEIKGWGGLNP